MTKISSSIEQYYSDRIIEFGAVPEGVDWNGEESQVLRFRQLCRIFPDSNFSVNDLGCGYGRFLEFLEARFPAYRSYRGYDLSRPMIDSANNLYHGSEKRSFIQIEDSARMEAADFTVASGIFNVKMDFHEGEWLSYILKTLSDMDRCSSRGFAFNVLTRYSDREHMKNNLYYADPMFFFDYCKRNFSSNIALLHDYDLYEFTILVRK